MGAVENDRSKRAHFVKIREPCKNYQLFGNDVFLRYIFSYKTGDCSKLIKGLIILRDSNYSVTFF